MNHKTKIIFMGTPEIATYALKALINAGYNVVSVITQPDRLVGRKRVLEETPVKKLAKQLNIKILQPEKIIDIYDELKKIDFDLFVTCAYGQFIPTKILDIPIYGCINAHGSILPKYRGGAPIQWSLINDEKITGVTLMKTIKQMDAGDVFIAYSVSINEDDNRETMFKKVGKAIYLILFNELNKIISGILKPIKQKEADVTFAPNISKENEKIDINLSAKKIKCWVNGLYNDPTGYLFYDNLKIKLFDIKITNICSLSKPGCINDVSKEGIRISTLDYDILLIDFQIEGKKRQKIKDFISGNRLFKIDNCFY